MQRKFFWNLVLFSDKGILFFEINLHIDQNQKKSPQSPLAALYPICMVNLTPDEEGANAKFTSLSE